MKQTYGFTEIKYSKPQLHINDNVLQSMAGKNADTRINNYWRMKKVFHTTTHFIVNIKL